MNQDMSDYGIEEKSDEIIHLISSNINAMSESMLKKYKRPVIDNVISRIKSPESIVNKLIRKKKAVSFKSALLNIHDFIGIRIICPFQDDVFRVAEKIKRLDNINISNIKDYISNPKESGYRSIHIIAKVKDDNLKDIFVEIQIRSVAMNYWAILEHLLCYKKFKAKRLKKELRNYAIEIAKIDKKFLKLRKRIEKIDLNIKEEGK